MATKAIHAWLFPILSLAVGLIWLGCFPLFGYRVFPFIGLLLGENFFGNPFPWLGVPALLAGIFGFLRPKPKEIWGYGFLMCVPQAIFAAALAISPGWLGQGMALWIVVSSFFAAVESVLASYAGFALRKAVNRIRAAPEEPPSILRK